MWPETCRLGSLCVCDEAIFCFYGLTHWRFLWVALRRPHSSGCEWPHCVHHQHSGCAVIAPPTFQMDPSGLWTPTTHPTSVWLWWQWHCFFLTDRRTDIEQATTTTHTQKLEVWPDSLIWQSHFRLNILLLFILDGTTSSWQAKKW